MSQLDRVRATSAQPYSASATTVGDEPLIVDLFPPGGSSMTDHWLIWGLSFLAQLTTRQPDTRGVPPNSGLFLCPPATPGETLAQAQAGIVAAARPFIVPLNDPYLDVAVVSSGPFGFTVGMSSLWGRLFVLPKGWFIRAILSCQQGGATPGPGINSQGMLTAIVTSEGDRDWSTCDPE